jgi:cytochrome c-type biogenesis protein CcmH/NrfF
VQEMSLSNLLKFIFFITISFFTTKSYCDEIENTTQSISEVVMSPYCPGRTLSSCPSEDARKLRFQISEWLKKGYSEAAVKRQLIGIYGKDVIGEPSFVGFGKIAWLSPYVIIILCLILLIRFLRKDQNKKIELTMIEDDTSIETKLKKFEKN